MKNNSVTIAHELSCGRKAVATTTGVSMEPLLIEGKSHVILAPVNGVLKKGDLPIFINPNGVYVIHRIIKVKEKTYHTRGDNCITYEVVPKEQVIGVVVEICRKGKKIKVTQASYRIYESVWRFIYPVRYMLKKAIIFIKGIVK